jgi:hypothetical protein
VQNFVAIRTEPRLGGAYYESSGFLRHVVWGIEKTSGRENGKNKKNLAAARLPFPQVPVMSK